VAASPWTASDDCRVARHFLVDAHRMRTEMDQWVEPAPALKQHGQRVDA
jgi:hypothetical protein